MVLGQEKVERPWGELEQVNVKLFLVNYLILLLNVYSCKLNDSAAENYVGHFSILF
jgi:hypothetical protein